MLDEGDGRIEDAIVLFADYECEYCRAMNAEFDSLVIGSGRMVVVRQLPGARHPLANVAARGAICAAKLGRFRAYNALLYADTSWSHDPAWGRVALAIGLADSTAFRTCFRHPSTSARLLADVRTAGQLSVTGTPTIVTREYRIAGIDAARRVGKVTRLEGP